MAYVALFGGAQVAVLWLVRDWFALWIPVAGTVVLALMPFLLRRAGLWPLKTLALVSLIGITTVGPVLSSMETRSHLGLTLEQDGLVQTEAAVDPLIARFFWTGHNDVCWIAMVLWALVWLGRRYPYLASVAFGTALALKAFAALALPLFALAVFLYWGGRLRGHVRSLALSAAALLALPVITMLPFFVRNPSAFLTDTVLYNTGTISGGYFISGFGFSGLLLAPHLLNHRPDSFPFLVFQVSTLLPSLFLGARWFFRGRTLGRWMAAYAFALFVFIFFARFMNDSYIGLTLALAASAAALNGHRIISATHAEPDRESAFAA